jgi:hypothetical protein
MTYTNNASSNIDHEYHNQNNSSQDQNPTIPFLNCRMWCDIIVNVLLEFHIAMWCGEMDRIKNSRLLSLERGNESHYLIFWSLGTPTTLRDWARGLIAEREGISTPNTSYVR